MLGLRGRDAVYRVRLGTLSKGVAVRPAAIPVVLAGGGTLAMNYALLVLSNSHFSSVQEEWANLGPLPQVEAPADVDQSCCRGRRRGARRRQRAPRSEEDQSADVEVVHVCHSHRLAAMEGHR